MRTRVAREARLAHLRLKPRYEEKIRKPTGYRMFAKDVKHFQDLPRDAIERKWESLSEHEQEIYHTIALCERERRRTKYTYKQLNKDSARNNRQALQERDEAVARATAMQEQHTMAMAHASSRVQAAEEHPKLLLDSLLEWVRSSCHKDEVKGLDIARRLFWVFQDNDMTADDIPRLRKHIQDHPFVFQEGNLWEQLKKYFASSMPHIPIKFWKDMANITTKGMATSPNAAAGKYELLYHLLRPQAIQPKKGDALEKGCKTELKGNHVSLRHECLTGREYILKTNAIFETHFNGNTSTAAFWKTKGEVFEIEKPKNRAHYQRQFSGKPALARKLMVTYMATHGFGDMADAENIVSADGTFHQDRMLRIILQQLFKSYQKRQEFNRVIVFGDGTQVKIIDKVEDLCKFKMTEDFFRIGQAACKVGWYIK